MQRRCTIPMALGSAMLTARDASAGMPAPFPEDWKAMARLTEDSLGRLQAISFFLMVMIVSVIAVQLLWNIIARDSQWIPRITLFKAFAVVVLWGSLFVVVLTMISGARELLTPGAWKKNGITYTLQEGEDVRPHD